MTIKTRAITALCRLLRLMWKETPPPPAPAKILMLKPCCLGDVVLATATIGALKYRYPAAQLDMAVGSWSRAVVENSPHLGQIIDTGSVGQGHYTIRDFWPLVRRLRAEQYDLVVTLDRSPIIALLPWLADIPHRIGLDSFQRGFAHTVRVPVSIEPRHEAQIYLDCAAASGTVVQWEAQNRFWPKFYPTEADQAAAAEFKVPFAILHPTGGLNPGMVMLDKRWPVDRFAQLGDRLAEAGYQIVLTGVEADLPLCQQVADQMQVHQPTIVAGQLSLGQFGALCQRAALFVGGDTGAMHLAAACECKVVAIFGPSDPRRYAPFGPADRVTYLWHPFAIPSGGVGQGQVTNFSWDDGVTVDEVWEACQRLLNPSM